MKTIDLRTWHRKEAFEYFNSYEIPHFNVCANVTITNTYLFLKDSSLSRFTAYMWMICNVANGITELRYRIKNDKVVEHDIVHPAFAWLKDDNTLTFCRAEYTPTVGDFFVNVEKSVKGLNPNPIKAQTAGDVLYISCVPWINFTSVSHPVKKDATECIPRISWGKFTEQHGTWTMPVSLQLHHGLADGYHVGLFFERLQKILDTPEKLDWPL